MQSRAGEAGHPTAIQWSHDRHGAEAFSSSQIGDCHLQWTDQMLLMHQPSLSEFRPHRCRAFCHDSPAGTYASTDAATWLASTTVHGPHLLFVELPCLFLKHNRNPVADRIGKARGPADKLLTRLVVKQRR